MRRNIKRKFIATLCAVTMIVGNMSISTYADDAALKITKQPTEANPTVVVNKDDASYQWYKAEIANEYEVADLTGTIVNDAIIGTTYEDTYVGDGIWTNDGYSVDIYISVLAGDKLIVTEQDGYDVYASLPGNGNVDVDGVWEYEFDNDTDTKVSLIEKEDGGASAKIEIVRDGVTYPVVSGMKECIDGKLCANISRGSYTDEGRFLSNSNGMLQFALYLKENQIVNFNMDNVEEGKMDISLGGDMSIIIPENGEYSYYAQEEGFYRFYINNGISFDVDITVSELERGQAVTGQTTDTLTTFEEGERYSCLVTCGEEEVGSNFIVGTLAIKTQPTAGNPTVELNYDVDATYQWYIAEKQIYNVVDSGEPADDEMNIDYIYGGYYSDGTWYGEENVDYWGIDAEITASKGDKVIITLPDDFDGIVYDYYTSDEFTYNNGAYEYTIIESDGYLNFTIESSEEFTADIQVETCGIGDAIEGETKATLQNYEYGETYVCKIVTEDDVEMVSDYVNIQFVISSQPTATNPTVEVNFPDMVSKYQWYEMEMEELEVVDGNVVDSDDVIVAQDMYGTYENGVWKSLISGDDENTVYVMAVMLYIEKGDIIKVTPSVELMMAGYEYNGGSGDTSGDYLECENGVYYHEFTSEMQVFIMAGASEEFTAEITVEKMTKGEAVEGQTTNKLTNHIAGDYICEMTLTDGTTVLSDMISITEADITHTYTDMYDVDCNDCGAIREVPEKETTTDADGSDIGTVSPNTADGVDMMLILLLACAGIAGTLLTPVFNKKRYQ